MNFSNIRYFQTIVEEGSISAAARKLYISQQALSEQLKKMEEELGVPLLKRGRKAELTVAGECLYRDGRELLRIYDGMMNDIQDVTAKRRKKITVGIPTFWTPHYFPELLARFRARYPEYEVAVVKRQHTDVEYNMSGVDLYLSPLPLNPHLEHVIILDSDPFHITVHRRLAQRIYGDRWPRVEEQLRSAGDLSLLKEMPFIALRDRYGQLVQSLQLIFNEFQFSPVFEFNSESFDLNEHACVQGLGCLLTTRSRIDHLLSTGVSDLLTYPIRVTSFEPKLAVSHRKGQHLHVAELRFIEELKSLIGDPMHDHHT